MQEVNIYYVGIMLFFLVYASSTITYRKAGNTLVTYASFFIWIQYFWSLIKKDVDPDSEVAKIFMMLTFSKYSDAESAQTGINMYLAYQIPYGQWVILICYVMLAAINVWFQDEKQPF
jgi:hypothetical protein